MIRNIQKKDILQVAKLHKKNLPSFLAEYSISFIEKFYNFQLNKESELLLGEFDESQLLGFVFGTNDVEKLYAEFIRLNRFYFYFETLKTLLLHPRYLVLFLKKAVSKPNFTSNCKRQLVYIVVDPTQGKKGIGKNLVTALETAWNGVDYYELEVESQNNAYDFYLRNGFFLVHEYNNWVEKKFLLGKQIRP